jgi:hypothetical protein
MSGQSEVARLTIHPYTKTKTAVLTNSKELIRQEFDPDLSQERKYICLEIEQNGSLLERGLVRSSHKCKKKSYV